MDATVPSSPGSAGALEHARGGERGVVLTLIGPDAQNRRNHESVTRSEMARRLARLKGFAFAGEYDPAAVYPEGRYFVPADTMIGCDRAATLGIHDEDDLFGAVVPRAFMAVKTITHPVLGREAQAPEGWCHDFCDAVSDAVLAGYAAFHRADARRAVARLLERGPARVKRASGIGGQGQTVIETLSELDAVLGDVDDEELATLGIVIEENLGDVITHSVGQVRVAGVVASYCGVQRLTLNNRGVSVYGGSTLLVVRGEFDRLLCEPLSVDTRLAIERARRYDAAADAHFGGMFASRRNYDVAQGSNRRGERCCGVLEQSWRLGGASGAEIGALEAFRKDPSLSVVRATSTEIYGDCTPPGDAIVYFHDEDDRVGMLTKYTVIERHGHA